MRVGPYIIARRYNYDATAPTLYTFVYCSRAADGVDAKGVEGVVVAEPGLELYHGEVGGEAADETDDDGAAGIDVAAGGTDDDEAADGAGAEAEDAGFFSGDEFGEGP